MFLILKESHEHGACNQNCFGPVMKIKIYNYASHGYLQVNGSTVTSKSEDGIIYKISAGQNFYLYDMKAKKFICWKRPHRTKSGQNRKHNKNATIIARTFSSYNCQFKDLVAKNVGGYVNLVAAFNNNLKMKFNSKGKVVSQKCIPPVDKIKLRHMCRQQTLFLISPYKDRNFQDERACQCPEARYHFCNASFAKMKVFKNICNLSNETYDS